MSLQILMCHHHSTLARWVLESSLIAGVSQRNCSFANGLLLCQQLFMYIPVNNAKWQVFIAKPETLLLGLTGSVGLAAAFSYVRYFIFSFIIYEYFYFVSF